MTQSLVSTPAIRENLSAELPRWSSPQDENPSPDEPIDKPLPDDRLKEPGDWRSWPPQVPLTS